MMQLIGDASFTITANAVDEITLDTVVAKVCVGLHDEGIYALGAHNSRQS